MHALRRTSGCSTARSSAPPTEDEAAAISPAEVWPFPYPRSAGPVGWSRSAIAHGRAHARAPEYLEEECADHGHPVTEMGWVGRHGTVCFAELG